MGRIKPLMVKRAGYQLAETVSEFSDNFEHNKKLLKNTMPSKSIRNKVAGYIVRLEKKRKQKDGSGDNN
jgi:small subunit ribosomal protein S17e